MPKMKTKEDVNKIRPENFNPRQMMDIANAYLNAAKKCNSDPTVELLLWSHPLILPIVTNAAFACEIFLKAILQKHKRLKNGHNLRKIFEALPEEAQSIILGSKHREVFNEDLTRISCLFEKWRYIYEYEVTSINFRFLMDFAEELSTITGKIM